MANNYGTPSLMLARGRGSHVWDDQGRIYTDLLGGIAVQAVGHTHPKVVTALQQAATTLLHTSNLYAHEAGLALAERLAALTGGHRALFVNSGAEANEAAFKLARRRAHELGMADARILAFEGAFHGRTMGALSLTGQLKHHAGFGPLIPGVHHIPFNDVGALENALEAGPIGAVFYEPVQGESGVVPMDDEVARVLARKVPQAGGILVADEVQTGVGRCGTFLASDALRLAPDVVTLAKGLGGGLPIGACLLSAPLLPYLPPGSHGCTFGGNPLAASSALAVIEIIEQEGLSRRAQTLGIRALRRLELTLAGTGVHVRGRGLLIGIELPTARAREVVGAAQQDGVLVGQAGNSVVRLAPALNIPEEVLFQGIDVVAASVRDVLAQRRAAGGPMGLPQ